MILLCGIPTEGPLERVIEAVEAIGAPHVVFNQREVGQARLEMEIIDGAVDGTLELATGKYRLSEIRSVYSRLMDDRFLPEIESEDPNAPIRVQSRAVHDLLLRWMEMTPARVVNRASAMASNFSKPYQAQLIRGFGFQIPDTLVTNRPEAVRTFLEHHGRVIYKSVSAVRSIVQDLTEKDLESLDKIRWCPTLFQRWIEGRDVRVHVIGERVIATGISSAATDYRYARRDGGDAELVPVELDPELEGRCVALSQGLGLDFAGIDLRIHGSQVHCFEVNPSPAYSYYEAHTGQPIARAVAEYLADVC